MSNRVEPPYPTSHAIEDMMSKTGDFRTAIIDALDDNVDAKVMGYDHHFAGDHKGKENLGKNFAGEFASMIDAEKVQYEVFNVVGGGESPWAAIEAKAVGKTKTGIRQPYFFRFMSFHDLANTQTLEVVADRRDDVGKKLDHDHAYVVRFNGQGKIVKLRAYLDTHHLHKHAVDQGKSSA